MKITIKHYAEREGISVQSVYVQIERGSLKSVEENGVKYVLFEDKDIKSKIKRLSSLLKKMMLWMLKE